MLQSDPANLSLNVGGKLFFPYGLILYSLIGSLAIPEIINLLKKEKQELRLIKPISLVGTMIPALIYFIFAFGIFSAAGKNTTPDGLSGLLGIVPFALIYLASLMAFLEIITSYFVFEVSVFQTLRTDFKFKKKLALAAVVFLPLAFFFLGATDFLRLMGVMGSVLISLDSILVVLAYLALKRINVGYKYQLIRLPAWLGGVLIAVLLGGGVLGLVYSL